MLSDRIGGSLKNFLLVHDPCRVKKFSLSECLIAWKQLSSLGGYHRLLHEAISDESFRMPVSDVLHHHSLHSHILALLPFILPYKVWLKLLELVHQTLKMMIFKIMQQISYYPGPLAMWQILALEET